MALPLDLEDLAGHTGPGCVHAKLSSVLQALRAWKDGPAFLAAGQDLKTKLEAACPGVIWNQNRIRRAIRLWIEEA